MATRKTPKAPKAKPKARKPDRPDAAPPAEEAAQAPPAAPAEPAWPADSVERRPIATLIPRQTNPRTHSTEQVEKIANSMRTFGWTIPVLVDERGELIAGHGRLMAAQTIGWVEAPVMVARGWSEAKKRAYVIADNKLTLDGGWNEDLLKAELKDLKDLEELGELDVTLTGFSEDELDKMFAGNKTEGDEETEDEAPVPPEYPITRPADVWLCGPHRVICGDSRQADVIKRLMGGELADCAWLDHPYNVDYEGTTSGKIKNDAKPQERFALLLRQAFKNVYANLHQGSAIYVAHADREGLNFYTEFLGAGFHLSNCLIWVKNSLVLGRCDYNSRHEPILYGWKPGQAHRWYGDRDKATIFESAGEVIEEVSPSEIMIHLGERSLRIRGDDGAPIHIEDVATSTLHENKPKKSGVHPTMKPVALVERMLLNSTKQKDKVLDVFGGSGTTLIAAHKNNRIGYICELDPKFVDVIVRRWQEFSGQPALRERDHVMFDKANHDRRPKA